MGEDILDASKEFRMSDILLPVGNRGKIPLVVSISKDHNVVRNVNN